MIYGDFKGCSTRLRPVTMDDAEFIFNARTLENRNQYLSPIDGTVDNQREWLKKYFLRHADRLEYYWVIEDTNHNSHGLIRIYDINWSDRSFLIGSWLILPGAPLLMAQESTALCYEYAFHELQLETCRFDVMRNNRKVIRFHRCYAREVSSDEEFLHFEFSRKEFENSFFTQFLTAEKQKDKSL